MTREASFRWLHNIPTTLGIPPAGNDFWAEFRPNLHLALTKASTTEGCSQDTRVSPEMVKYRRTPDQAIDRSDRFTALTIVAPFVEVPLSYPSP